MIGRNNYGNPFRSRRPAQQLWAVGEQVKVGFLSLRIVGGNAAQGWNLTNQDASKKYIFVPHEGLLAVDSFEATV